MDLTPNPANPPDPCAEARTDTARPVPEHTAAGERETPGIGPVGAYPTRSAHEIGGKKFRVGAGDTYVPFRSRTKRRRRTIGACVVGALALGAGTYGLITLVDPTSHAPAAAGCPATGASARFTIAAGAPSATQIKLNVYNSTNRHGLAATTADLLKQRGFPIGKVTNDPLIANLTVAAQIRGGAASAAAMRVVAAEVVGAQFLPDARVDTSVDFVLGSSFTALATPEQVSAALAASKAADPTPKKCG
jgi:hypothetical protein